MDGNSINSFLEKLRREKSEEEVGNFLAGLMKFGAAELYYTMMSVMTEDDMTTIDQIADDEVASAEIIKRFKQRTGMTPEEFVKKLSVSVAKEYVSPTASDQAN